MRSGEAMLGRRSLSSGAAMGLSQAELAGLLGRPAGWVSLVAARTGDPAAAYEQLS